MRRSAWIAVVVWMAALPAVWAWGPHTAITQAALDALPDGTRWRAALGAANVEALLRHCWMPDNQGQDLGEFYADDYLLIPELPRYVGHTMPTVAETWAPHFRRSLQALRTETPVNACRQLGPLLHFVEDSGSPPHAKEKCPHHGELENWVGPERIAIAGYSPRLLGATDAAAEAGLRRRMSALVAFSAAQAEKALPMVSAPTPDRARVEALVLESALETARVAADLLHTLFTLGLAPQPPGASLTGRVTAPALPTRNAHGARIVLLGSAYATLAPAGAAAAGARVWEGGYELRNLPAGRYRVCAYRTGARPVVREIALRAGQAARLDFDLPAVEPADNLVENPDATLRTLPSDEPDRWHRSGAGVWSSNPVRVFPLTTYRCGAVLKDPTARVRFRFTLPAAKRELLPEILKLPVGQARPAEIRYRPGPFHWSVTVLVETGQPLAEAIERVWVAPDGR